MFKIYQITFFSWLFLLLGSVCSSNEKRNFIILFADDLGPLHLGFKDKNFHTPHIDSLKKESLYFPRAYIASPSCSPSRATLVTGRHPAAIKMTRHIPDGKKYGFDENHITDQEFNLFGRGKTKFPSRNWLPLNEITYAETLQSIGYHNVFVGKWHLGSEEYHPEHQGFDETLFVNNYGHPENYYSPFFKNSNKTDKGYLTDHLTDQTIQWIEKYDQKKPFQLSLFYYSAHDPFIGRKDLVEFYKSKGFNGNNAEYMAMVSSIDESVGRIRESLRKKGIDKNTVLIFLSDQSSKIPNGKLRGKKLKETLYEGGSNIPFLIYDPKSNSAGKENLSLVQSTDIFPTLIDLAGHDSNQHQHLHGKSLYPLINGKENLARDSIFAYRTYSDEYATVHYKQWKLIAFRNKRRELYQLTNDPYEQNDLSKQKPEIVENLNLQLKNWEIKMGVHHENNL